MSPDVLIKPSSLTEAKSAADVCYEVVNSKGDRFGNCGGKRKCSTRLPYISTVYLFIFSLAFIMVFNSTALKFISM